MMEDESLPEQALIDTKEMLVADVVDKGKNVAAFFLNVEAECDAITIAMDRMKKRLETLKRKSNWLKLEIQCAMERCDISEISCPEFKVILQKNPAHVVIDDELLLSPEYFERKVSITPNKTKIKEQLKNGVLVEGAHLESRNRLVIK